MNIPKPLLAMLIVVVGLVAPRHAQADIFRPSVQDQIKIGKQVHDQILKEAKVLPDADPRTQLVRQLGEAMVAKIPESERKSRPFEYRFYVLQSRELNAFAVPGGGIYIYSGLIARMRTVDQLAGVVGHEIIHVRNQHWASAYADSIKRRLGLTIVLTILGAGDWVFDVADAVDTFFVGLPYSRRHEAEADRLGFDLMAGINMNPQGLVDTFALFAENEDTSAGDFLRTHPLSRDRVKAMQDRIAKSNRSFPPQRFLPLNLRVPNLRWVR